MPPLFFARVFSKTSLRFQDLAMSPGPHYEGVRP